MARETTLTIRMTDEERRGLDALAAADNRKPSDFLRNLLIQEIKKGLPEAEPDAALLTLPLAVRVSTAELEQLKRRAAKDNRAIGDYVRRAILNSSAGDADPAPAKRDHKISFRLSENEAGDLRALSKKHNRSINSQILSMIF